MLTAVQDNPMSSRSNANSILDPVVKYGLTEEEGCWVTISCTAK